MKSLDELRKYYVAPEDEDNSSEELNSARARLDKLNSMLGDMDKSKEDFAKELVNKKQDAARDDLIGLGNDFGLSALGGSLAQAATGNPAVAAMSTFGAVPMADMLLGKREKGNVPEGQPHYDPKIHSVNVPGMNMDVGRPAFYFNKSVQPIADAGANAVIKGADMIKSVVGNPMYQADYP